MGFRTRMDQKLFGRGKLRATLAGLPAPILGVDEVGRGCLAGPVVAGAVIFSERKIPKGLTDSKLLSESQRENLYPQILEHHFSGIGVASVEEIDQINIFHASHLAMRRAIKNLEQSIVNQSSAVVGFVLVDGAFEIPQIPHPQAAVIKGDLKVPMIAAASIIAKVWRDRLMKELDEVYPVFGFAKHKGYSSPYHRQAIQIHKPCILHRRSFSGVREYLVPTEASAANEKQLTL